MTAPTDTTPNPRDPHVTPKTQADDDADRRTERLRTPTPDPTSEDLAALEASHVEDALGCRDTEELMALGMGGDLPDRAQVFFDEHIRGCSHCQDKASAFRRVLVPLSSLGDAEESTLSASAAADLWSNVHARIADSVRAGRVQDRGLPKLQIPARRDTARANAQGGSTAPQGGILRLSRVSWAAAVLIAVGLGAATLIGLANRGGTGASSNQLATDELAGARSNAPTAPTDTSTTAGDLDNGERVTDDGPQPDDATVEGPVDDGVDEDTPVAVDRVDAPPPEATPARRTTTAGLGNVTTDTPSGTVPFASVFPDGSGAESPNSASGSPAQFASPARGTLAPPRNKDRKRGYGF